MLNLIVLFGGASSEHDISILSAKNVVSFIDAELYQLFIVYITKDGLWKYIPQKDDISLDLVNQEQAFSEVSLLRTREKTSLQFVENGKDLCNPNIVFPVLHGKNGEDGVIQGLLQSLQIPYAGPSLIAAAISMDKATTKDIVRGLGVKVSKDIVIRKGEQVPIFSEVIKVLRLPFIVKPSRAGSSFGVSIVQKEEDYLKAIESAFLCDSKILFEEFIQGREIECGVLGNYSPKASTVGEISYPTNFYSYEAKYKNTQSQIHIPALVSENVIKTIQDYSKKIYKSLNCLGFARVDFFLTQNGEVIFNELNSIPGFTDRSMFPLLWQYEGISQSNLINEIIKLGLEAYSDNLC